MAAPHVAGALARYLGVKGQVSPAEAKDMILQAATTDKVNSTGEGTPNRLLFVDYNSIDYSWLVPILNLILE